LNLSIGRENIEVTGYPKHVEQRLQQSEQKIAVEEQISRLSINHNENYSSALADL
jgi:hypothetical protein